VAAVSASPTEVWTEAGTGFEVFPEEPTAKYAPVPPARICPTNRPETDAATLLSGVPTSTVVAEAGAPTRPTARTPTSPMADREARRFIGWCGPFTDLCTGRSAVDARKSVQLNSASL
jgi:hypothetical protein